MRGSQNAFQVLAIVQPGSDQRLTAGLGQQHTARGGVAFSVVSFAGCVLLTYRRQPWAFFGTPARAWEFGFGALATLVPVATTRGARAVWHWLGWIGVAMVVALTSLLTDRPVRADVAMTGEISLRGLVLPIGGVKEKVLAALRAGITTVMLPARNRRDLEDSPRDALEQLRIELLEQVDDAIRIALAPAVPRPARDADASRRGEAELTP